MIEKLKKLVDVVSIKAIQVVGLLGIATIAVLSSLLRLKNRKIAQLKVENLEREIELGTAADEEKLKQLEAERLKAEKAYEDSKKD